MHDNVEMTIPRMESLRTLSKESKIPYNRIRLWCLEGKLPYIKSGNRFLVNVESFIKLLEGKSNEQA